jgi:hypothetical protein
MYQVDVWLWVLMVLAGLLEGYFVRDVFMGVSRWLRRTFPRLMQSVWMIPLTWLQCAVLLGGGLFWTLLLRPYFEVQDWRALHSVFMLSFVIAVVVSVFTRKGIRWM